MVRGVSLGMIMAHEQGAGKGKYGRFDGWVGPCWAGARGEEVVIQSRWQRGGVIQSGVMTRVAFRCCWGWDVLL